MNEIRTGEHMEVSQQDRLQVVTELRRGLRRHALGGKTH